MIFNNFTDSVQRDNAQPLRAISLQFVCHWMNLKIFRRNAVTIVVSTYSFSKSERKPTRVNYAETFERSTWEFQGDLFFFFFNALYNYRRHLNLCFVTRSTSFVVENRVNDGRLTAQLIKPNISFMAYVRRGQDNVKTNRTSSSEEKKHKQ